jgi:hypothetical protein
MGRSLKTWKFLKGLGFLSRPGDNESNSRGVVVVVVVDDPQGYFFLKKKRCLSGGDTRKCGKGEGELYLGEGHCFIID